MGGRVLLPLLPWFLAYFAGVLIAQPRVESAVPWFLAGACSIWAFGIVLSRRPFRGWRPVLLVLVFCLAVANVLLRSENLPADHVWHVLQHDKKARIEGVVVDVPQKFPDKVRYTVRLEAVDYGSGRTPVSGTAWINLYGQEEPFQWGTRVRFPRIRLRRPLNFRNPGRSDYEAFMRASGVDVSGGTSRWQEAEALGPVALPWGVSQVLTARGRMQELLQDNLPERERGLLGGMVFGDKSGLDPQLLEAYRTTGMGHLLAVSGLHIGFVAFTFYWVGHRLLFYAFWKLRPEWAQFGFARQGAALVALAAVLVYMALVGPRVSSLRAGVLVIAFLIAFWIHREREMLNTLLLAALLILLWKPAAVYSLGFQLSFLAVLGIVLALRWIAEPGPDPLERLGEIPWYRRWAVPEAVPAGWKDRGVDILVAAAFISLAAWVATFPVILYEFHQINLAAPFLNTFLVPLASVLIPACLMVLFTGFVAPGLAGALLVPIGWLTKLIFVEAPSRVAALPEIAVQLPHPPEAWRMLFYLFVAGLAYRFFRGRHASERRPLSGFWKRVVPWSLCVCGVVLILGLMFPRGLDRGDGRLHVWMLDVGQGEALYIEFPNGQNLLLDGGGYFKDALDVGARVVGDFLWDRGVGTIDYLAVTHSDQDHIDGVESVLEAFDIGHFLARPDGSADRRYARLTSRATVRGVPLKPFGAGEVLRVGEVVLKNLHPDEAFNREVGRTGRGRLNNDRSWVILLEYRRFRMLLTGDITEKAERWLVGRGADLRAQVLKAPHHGSRTSSSAEFLDAVKPREVLVSSGFANYFHHPHADVVRRYRDRGVRVWNTGERGAFHLTSGGDGYEISDFKGLSNWN